MAVSFSPLQHETARRSSHDAQKNTRRDRFAARQILFADDQLMV
ncbi:MAG: hypothetical protein Q8P60_10405 [Pseudorhodobacter sp.]|nr:hypothetical protein [Pseudorhodobacter sp.]